jgi:hypothetical protein
MSRPTICIKPLEFNELNLVINEPKVYQAKNSKIKMTTSDILYQNEKGELCNLFVKLPSVNTYGPSPQYDFNSKNKNTENIQGYTISYSHSEVEKMFEVINKVCQNTINDFAKSNLIKKCTIKPEFNFKKSGEGAKVAYFKLNTVRDYQSNLLTILTKMSKNTNESIDPIETVSKYGTLTPMIQISKIYYGAHGNSEYGASIQSKVVRIKFIQISTTIPDFTSSDEEYES